MTKPKKVKSGTLVSRKVALPAVIDESESLLIQITGALGLPRDVLPSQDQIAEAWERIPRILKNVPTSLRDERFVKMCVAVYSGLFDAAVNYVWNAAVVELRNKVRRFGLDVIPQILDKSKFDDSDLVELRDAELLDLCLKLNLIGDDDFFFLDQCRATRNNFSAAHPADGALDEYEFVAFLSRCQKHALSSGENPKGVNVKKLLEAVKGSAFKDAQKHEWAERITATFDAQQELIFAMLHGIYCDPSSSEVTRRNAIEICNDFGSAFSSKTISALVDQHQDYRAKGDDKREAASRNFFMQVGILSALSESEIHHMITTASKKLLDVHNAFDNFYNEPPFAERLERLTREISIPKTAQSEFVEAVITAGIGNQYGVSNSAMPFYEKMVRSFSPAEIVIMFNSIRGESLLAKRMKHHTKCQRRFKSLVKELSESSVPTSVKATYKHWLK